LINEIAQILNNNCLQKGLFGMKKEPINQIEYRKSVTRMKETNRTEARKYFIIAKTKRLKVTIASLPHIEHENKIKRF
jgi:hypothetical protein